MSQKSKPIHERFWEKVNCPAEQGGCWLWTVARTSEGYGSFKFYGRTALAHRVAFEYAKGPIPPRMTIDHTCFRRECVNPSHLRAVTSKQNNEHLRGAYSNSSSGIRNVYWLPRARKWVVTVMHNRQVVSGGRFTDIRDAERAAIALRAALFSHDDYRAKEEA